jgi:hypothetical protein
MTGTSAFSAAGQNQSAVSVRQPSNGRVGVEGDPNAEHSALLLPSRQQRRGLRILERDAAHDAEAVGITLDCLEGIVVLVARP